MPSLGNTTYTGDFEEAHGVKIEDYVKGVQDEAASVVEVEEADTESPAPVTKEADTPSLTKESDTESPTPVTKVVTPPAAEKTPTPSGPDVKTA